MTMFFGVPDLASIKLLPKEGRILLMHARLQLSKI